ncbi:Osteoclast-stimulating factor 1 [Nymphon striatum]|nr:Osteoclast-stimulating factor 1 [Nymphon striatum]
MKVRLSLVLKIACTYGKRAAKTYCPECMCPPHGRKVSYDGVENLVAVDDNINADTYVKIIDSNFSPVIACYFSDTDNMFQDDSIPVYRVIKLKTYLEESNTHTLKWPAPGLFDLIEFEESKSKGRGQAQKVQKLFVNHQRTTISKCNYSSYMKMALRPAPPKPIPKPGQVKVVKASYKYTANQADELSFEEGDTLYIVDMTTDPNWWKAKCGNKTGFIPSNYVEENTESIVHPLHESAKRGNLSFLQECLSNGVSVNSLDKAGSTALHWASHGGHLECMQKLLNTPNMQINVQNRLGDTPLHSAAWKSHADAVMLLLDKGYH